MTIESAQTVPGAKPKEAFRVSYDLNDESASDFGGGVGPDWQLLGVDEHRYTMLGCSPTSGDQRLQV